MSPTILWASAFMVLCFLGEQFFSFQKSTRLEFFKHFLLNLVYGLVSIYIVNFLHSYLPAFDFTPLVSFQKTVAPVFLLVVIALVLDFSSYLWHRLNHQFSFLWRFHSVHHIDTHLCSSSAVRFHFGELFLGNLYRLLWIKVFGMPSETVLLFNLLYLCANVFQHSDILLPDRFERALRILIVTPGMHRVHHSRLYADRDRNFSTLFSFWDYIFRTYLKTGSQDPLPLGDYHQKKLKFSFVELLVYPFKKL